MRILILTRSTLEHPQKGGMEVHAAQVAAGLAARGHTVDVLTTAHPDGVSERVIGGATYHFLGGTRPGAYSPEWWTRSAEWARARHAAHPYDAMLAESGAAEGVLAERLSAPIVVVCHGLAGWTLAGMWRGLGTTTSIFGVARMAYTWVREQMQFAFRTHQYDAIACVSEPLVHAVRSQWHYDASRVVAVPNGIDVSRFVEASNDAVARERVRASWGVTPARTAILVSGRLEPDKGVHLALEALRELPRDRVALIIAGDGSARGTLEARSRELGLTGCVRFLGHQPVAEMPALHAAADIYLFPTLLSESFGLGAAEAMAAGRPVVAPPVGGLPMLVEHGVTGLAFPVGDARGIASSLRALLDDPARASSYGAEGQRRASARFTEERMLEGFETVLKKAAEARRAPAA